MPRRTKEDAAQTRHAIVMAAAEMFHRHGVSGTSLEQIAAAANITRGAIYWHFKNKAELFLAVRSHEPLPLIDSAPAGLSRMPEDPLRGLELALTGIVDTLAGSVFLKRVHQIIAFRCEYDDALMPMFDRVYRAPRQNFVDALTRFYRAAQQRGLLRPGFGPLSLAQDTAAFVQGILTSWLVDDGSPAATRRARRMIRQHIALRRA